MKQGRDVGAGVVAEHRFGCPLARLEVGEVEPEGRVTLVGALLAREPGVDLARGVEALRPLERARLLRLLLDVLHRHTRKGGEIGPGR